MDNAYCTDGRSKKGIQTVSRKLEGKRPLSRSKIRWEDNIIWDLKKVGYEDDLKAPAQDRVIWRAYMLEAMNLRVP